MQSAIQKQGDGAFAFTFSSILHSFSNLFPLSRQPFYPLRPSNYLTTLIYYYPPSLFFLCPCNLPLLSAPASLSSPFNFSLSPLCSLLTRSSERPIRLHRGFTGWGCEGKPKWNAAHPSLLMLRQAYSSSALRNHQTTQACVHLCASASQHFEICIPAFLSQFRN